MSLLYLVGDSHGNEGFIRRALHEAATVRDALGQPLTVVSLGDYGFAPARRIDTPDDSFALITNTWAIEFGLPLLVVPGNHDYPGLDSDPEPDINGYWAWETDSIQPHQPGLAAVRRGQTFEIEAGHDRPVTVGGFGGAVSIDRRIRRPPGPDTRGTWWPTEAITEAEVEAVEQSGNHVDLALTHDAPARPPGKQLWRDPLDPTLADDLEQNTMLLRRVVAAWRPQHVYHGHWHHRYTHAINIAGGDRVRITGLSAESTSTSTLTVDLTELRLDNDHTNAR